MNQPPARKKKWLLPVRLFALLCAVVPVYMLINGKAHQARNDIPPFRHPTAALFLPENGCVPDEKTALAIAEAVLLPVYGETLEDDRPLRAHLMSDSVWVVIGTIPEGVLGGVVYIEIAKRDGRILGMIHGG